MARYLTVVPAYGRDYKSAKAAKADWMAEKDFNIAQFGHPYDGKPMNRQQVQPGEVINIRFDNLRKICKAG